MKKHAQEQYRFTIKNDQIVAIYEIERGRAEREEMERDEIWSYDPISRQVTEQEYDDGRLELTLYTDTDGDGLYVKQRESLGAQQEVQPAQPLDNLIGGTAGRDKLYGTAGDDVLHGAGGRDLLVGGRGADIFLFEQAGDLGLGSSRRDLIRDFKHSEGDRIDLSALDADPLLAGQQGFTLLSQAPARGEGTGVLWFAKGVLNISTDADHKAEYQIELAGVKSLSVDDLIL